MSEQNRKLRKRGAARDIVGKVTLLCVSTVLCLLLLEFVVRALFPFFNPKAQIPFYATDENFFLGPISRTVRQSTPKGDYDVLVSFNQFGFRDTKDLRRSAPEDIFVVGDSFSLGWGVEERERYSNLLEEKLRRRVFNISISEDLRGYARLVHYSERCGATIRNLIIGVCMENDLRDYSDGKTSVELFRDQKHPGISSALGERVRAWCWSHSALYIGASYTLQRNATIRGWMEHVGLARNIDQLTARAIPSEQVLASSRDELVQLAKGYRALIVIIPSRALWSGDNREREREVHDRFVQLLRQDGLDIVDLRPVFEQNPNPLDFYFKTDPHWNPTGHARAAKEIAEHIQNGGMSGPRPAAESIQVGRAGSGP